MITVYGIKSCDTVRKALKWLDSESIAHTFKDLRSDGFSESDVHTWMECVGWETLLNRRSTTWRGLDESDKADLDATKAARLMLAHPTLVKRPVFVHAGVCNVGFTDAVRESLRTLGQ